MPDTPLIKLAIFESRSLFLLIRQFLRFDITMKLNADYERYE